MLTNEGVHVKGADDQLFDSMTCLVLGNAVVGGYRPCCTFLARRFHPPHTPRPTTPLHAHFQLPLDMTQTPSREHYMVSEPSAHGAT